MLRTYLAAMCVFMPISAAAGDNAFNASLEHPTISSLITEFENVCFPFISHETELSAEQDRAVFQSRMVEAGYELGEEKDWNSYIPLEELSYSRSICAEGSFPPVASRVDGKYTIFPASSRVDFSGRILASRAVEKEFKVCPDGTYEVVKSSGRMGPRCELMGLSTPTITTYYVQDNYKKNAVKSISAYLTMQEVADPTESIKTSLLNTTGYSYEEVKVRTSFPPASACEIYIEDKSLTADVIESAIIDHDLDWIKGAMKDIETQEVISGAHHWRQCNSQDDEDYLYSVSLNKGLLSMKVKTLKDERVIPDYNCKSAIEEG